MQYHKSDTQPTPQQRLWHHLWKLAGADLWQCRWLLVKAYGYALIAVSALVLLPWPLKLIIDHVLSGQPIPLVLAPIETFLYRQHWLTTQTDVIVAL
ncbi:MAG TPA: hypothetical protein ENJ32_07480, partial [Crenotrichaceae bacterium]|nr:hypothetical protein [Crenotrichaceae bacterium]